MDGNDKYEKMVADVQFLELMLDAQHITERRDLTRHPPIRTKSEPVLDVPSLLDDSSSTSLRSFPTCGLERNALMKLVELTPTESDDKCDMVFSDSPAKPFVSSAKTQPIQCKPPPPFNSQKVVREIHSRSPADEMKDDSMMLKDAKVQEIQRPSVPPRSKPSSKEPPKPAVRPVPAPRKKKSDLTKSPESSQIVGPISKSQSFAVPPAPVSAWGPRPEIPFAFKPPMVDMPSIDIYSAPLEVAVPQATKVPHDTSQHALNDVGYLVKKVRSLSVNFASDDEKFPVVKELLAKCSFLDEKYNLVDFSRLLRDNKGPDRFLIASALKILEKYATNLLKPANQRPASWRFIKFANEVFQRKVGFLKGAAEILKNLGYDEEIFDEMRVVVGLKFPDTKIEPNAELVATLATDLCIAKFEVSAIFNEDHPNLTMLLQTKQIPKEYNFESDDFDNGDFEGGTDTKEMPAKLGEQIPSRQNYQSSKEHGVDYLQQHVVRPAQLAEPFRKEDPDRHLANTYQLPRKDPHANQRFQVPKTSDQLPAQNTPNYYSSDTTWVYNSSVTSPLEYREPHQNWLMSNEPPSAMHSRQNRPTEMYPSLEQGSIYATSYDTKSDTRQGSLPSIYTLDEASPQQTDDARHSKQGYLDSSRLPRHQIPSVYTDERESATVQENRVGYQGEIRLPPDFDTLGQQPFSQSQQAGKVSSMERPGTRNNSGTIEEMMKFEQGFPSSGNGDSFGNDFHGLNQNNKAHSSSIDYEYSIPFRQGGNQQRVPKTSRREEEMLPRQRVSNRLPNEQFGQDQFNVAMNGEWGEICWSCEEMLPPGAMVCANCGVARDDVDETEQVFIPPGIYEREASYSTVNKRPQVEHHNKPPSQECIPAADSSLKRNESLPRDRRESPFQNRRESLHRDQIGIPHQVRNESSQRDQRESHHQLRRESSQSLPATINSGAKSWSCKHCTFLNPVGENVCQMCFRTSWENNSKNDPEIEIMQAEYPRTGGPSINNKISYDPRPAHAVPVSPIHGGYPNFNIPENGYSPNYDRQGMPNQVNFPHENQQVSGNDFWTHEGLIRSQGYDGRLMRPPPSSDDYAQNEIYQKRPIRDRRSPRSMSEYELRKQRELAERVKREKKQQENMKKDALELIEILRQAETRGFQVEEVQIASKMSENVSSEIMNWLHNDWPKLKKDVIKECADEPGEISEEEAHDALIACDGNVKEASNLCLQERRAKIKELQESLKENGDVDIKDVQNALSKCKGNVKQALIELQLNLLKTIRDHIWQNHEKEGLKKLCDSLVKKDVKQDDRIKVVLAQYGMKSWGRARVAVRLIDEYSDERKDEDSFINDCIEAANANEAFQRAKRFMEHECPICTYPRAMCNMFTYLYCECQICDHCVAQSVTVTVKEQNIRDLVCPWCRKPEVLDEETSIPHFQHIEHKIKELVKKGRLEENIEGIFEDKLMQFSLKDDPNFRWCAHCPEYGFLWEDPQRNKMYCTKCERYTCFLCKEKWEAQHEGVTCADFKAWKIANDPDNQMHGLHDHLAENGIICPKCDQQYDLSRGGCIHFTCRACKHQFCGSCSGEFIDGKACPDHSTSGLHCHHPRNCNYYLRDNSVEDDQKLLTLHEVEFNQDLPEGQGAACRIMEQKEDGERLYDEACGKESPEGHAGLCEKHYKEYLVNLINDNNLDPLDIMEKKDMVTMMNRHNIDVPKQDKKEKDKNYVERLRKVAKEKIPLRFIGRKPDERPRIPNQPQAAQEEEAAQQQQQLLEQQVLQAQAIL